MTGSNIFNTRTQYKQRLNFNNVNKQLENQKLLWNGDSCNLKLCRCQGQIKHGRRQSKNVKNCVKRSKQSSFDMLQMTNQFLVTKSHNRKAKTSFFFLQSFACNCRIRLLLQ